MKALTTLHHDSTQEALHAIDLAEKGIARRRPLASSTAEKYRRAIRAYADDGRMLTDPDTLSDYSADLTQSGKAFLSAAVNLWADAMVRKVKATPVNNVNDVAAKQEAIWRFESMKTAVATEAQVGEKVHTWLSRAEVVKLMDVATGDECQAQRDRLALGLLVGAGLRREEAVKLLFEDVKLQPVKGKMRTVLQIQGKGREAAGDPRL